MAKQIPGKEEFHETIRYFNKQIELHGVKVKLNTFVDEKLLNEGGFDEIIMATGIEPRVPKIEGINHPKALSYIDVLKNKKPVGQKVAVIGAGGIGFDVSEYLLHEGSSSTLNLDEWLDEWGIDKSLEARSGIEGVKPNIPKAKRQITMFKRSKGKFGGNLGKTTGWIHRANLKKMGVKFIGEASYSKIDDAGLHYEVNGESHVLEVDNVVICAGQTPLKTLYNAIKDSSHNVHVIGGADFAAELDAKRAIEQGAKLASIL